MSKLRAAMLHSLWVWLSCLGIAAAQGLPTVTPEEVGLSSAHLAKLTDVLRTNITNGEIPGVVLLVARNGKIAYFESLGQLDPQAKTAMRKDAIFRIYSMSKPITSVAAMMLFEDAAFSLADPVGKYLPSLAKMQVATDNKPDSEEDPSKVTLVPAAKPITIQDLMRHTSGLTYGFFGTTPVKKLYVQANLGTSNNETNAEFVERIAKLPLSYQPGTTFDYSMSTDVLGRLVEVISGKSLFAFEKEKILDPLGMSDTSFYVTDQVKQSRIAEPLPNDRSLGTAFTIGDPRVEGKWEAGGQGMMSTALDYARFLQMLLNDGTLDGKRVLGPKTVAYMTADHLSDTMRSGPYYLPGPGYGFGLGFAVRRDLGGPSFNGSVGDYAWGGAAGTGFWVDPKERMLVVLMMQAPSQRLRYRTIVRDMVYAAITPEAQAAR
jgi:CubicO group peptidase (beta-lactamase class C family)